MVDTLCNDSLASLDRIVHLPAGGHESGKGSIRITGVMGLSTVFDQKRIFDGDGNTVIDTILDLATPPRDLHATSRKMALSLWDEP